MAKDWQKNEISYLKRYSDSKTLAELAERFDTDTDAVSGKLQELGLKAKDSGPALVDFYDDPAVDAYAEGVEAMHKGQWKKAQKALETAAANTDLPDVAEKARQMLQACAAQIGDEADDADEDPFLQAVYQKNQGQYEEALKLCKKHAKDERFTYLEASIYALQDEADKALASLVRAAEMNPKNRVYAYHDPDFEAVRKESQLEEFFQPS
jgi:tetratricopeptide (TPR) repeat protein